MALRLSVVSEHGIRLGSHSTKVFGVHGGSIGRGTDNEWILPDPERYLSGKHARVDYRAGSYILVDTSSNGTYVNGAQVPLGPYHDYTLKDGDYVRLGEYELLVSIDQSNDFPTDAGAIVASAGTAPSSSVSKSTADDIGADLDLSQLLEPAGQPFLDTGVRPRDSYGQVVTPGPTPPPAPASPADSADADTPWHMMTRPLKMELRAGAAAARAAGPVAPAVRAAQSALFEGDLEPGLVTFCRGAGLDPRSIPPEARGAALQLAGQLLRESVLGLIDLTQGRTEFRDRFRIAPPPEEGPESPLNLARGVEETMLRLLTNLSARAGPVEALRDTFKEQKAQNSAALAAMRTAFEAFLERVNPKDLEERFDRAGKRSVFGTPNKGKYWDLYAEMFPTLAQRPPDGFPHFFSEAFAKAYEAKLRTLIPPRRSAFGAERNAPFEPDAAAAGDL